MARVTIYYPWIYLRSGIERTLVEYTRRSRHEITLATSRYDAEGTYPELREMNVRIVGNVSVKRSYGAVIKAAWNIFRLRLDPQDHDVLIISCDGLGPLVALGNHQKPVLNYCFTPLRAVYDEEYRTRLLGGNPIKRTAKLAAETVFKALDRRAWSHFSSVYCDSRTARQRVIDGGLYPADEVGVIYPGIDADIIAPSDTFEPFFFLPGRIMWTKNIELAIDSFRQFAASHPDYRLIVAGMVDRKSQGYFAELREQAADLPAISFETDVSDARMDELYRTCSCVIQSAFNEDFGLTPLEGMARGKPCIAVDRGGPRETITHGSTGFLQEPTADSFAEAMQQLARDPSLARRMGATGTERVQSFTWQNFTRTLDDEVDRLDRMSA